MIRTVNVDNQWGQNEWPWIKIPKEAESKDVYEAIPKAQKGNKKAQKWLEERGVKWESCAVRVTR